MSYPQDNKSTHVPHFSGNISEVTGSLVVDTGVIEVQSAVASLAQDAAAGAAHASIEPHAREEGATIKATIKVWEDDGVTPASVAANVGWVVLGSR